MAGETTLLTVRSALRSVDVQVSADMAVQELVPLLVDLLELTAHAAAWGPRPTWELRPADARQPLAPLLTLRQAEVYDGAVLFLQQHDAWDV